jgi:hypothetical protein
MLKKRKLFSFALLAGLITILSVPAITSATTSVFGTDAVDSDFVASIIEYIPALFTELQLWIAVMVGIPLGFWAIRKLVSLVRLR